MQQDLQSMKTNGYGIVHQKKKLKQARTYLGNYSENERRQITVSKQTKSISSHSLVPRLSLLFIHCRVVIKLFQEDHVTRAHT